MTLRDTSYLDENSKATRKYEIERVGAVAGWSVAKALRETVAVSGESMSLIETQHSPGHGQDGNDEHRTNQSFATSYGGARAEFPADREANDER